jgi:UDP-galactopyranose mutase
MKKNILIVGAGFSGAVMARELALSGKFNIHVVDEREHIAGNCYTEIDEETGVTVHKYGPHIFNTDKLHIWEYIQQFSKFGHYTHRVKAVTQKGIFSLPINLLTINQFFGKTFRPDEAKEFISSLGCKDIEEPQNFEEQALKFLGQELYDSFFKGYTIKQWGCDPKNLPASILKRLPVRFNYDDSYYHSFYQGIPIDGYTAIIERILGLPQINVELSVKYDRSWNCNFDYIFYTGSIDAYYDFELGRLGYRTVSFKKDYYEGDYQGCSQMNYCELSTPYTRIHEHKHFTPWEDHDKTVFFQEFSKETEAGDVPYYPKRLSNDKQLLLKYRDLVSRETKVSFLGRLATYRYMDMHHVIGEALEFSREFLMTPIEQWQHFLRFPNVE